MRNRIELRALCPFCDHRMVNFEGRLCPKCAHVVRAAALWVKLGEGIHEVVAVISNDESVLKLVKEKLGSFLGQVEYFRGDLYKRFDLTASP